MGRDNGIQSSPQTLILSLLILSLSAVGSSSASPQDVRIVSATRRIDLTSSIVRVNLNLVVENTGASDVSEVLLAFSPTEAERMAILQASATSEGKRKKKGLSPLEVKPAELPNTPNGAKLFSVALQRPLKSNEKASLEVAYSLTRSLEPFPAEITQSDPQYVYYRDTAVLLSPYHVAEQVTSIKMPSRRVESYTRVEPTKQSGSELKYGHYRDQPSYSFSPILVHFENNSPFAVVEELVRVLEISHWGNLQVTDSYALKHGGAHHKGVFSRLEYQGRSAMGGGSSSFKNLLAMLPPRVHSVYYRDDIGNVSTSHLRAGNQKSELEIEPRYPLLGGWKATFVIGYGLPLSDFLFESPEGQRYLNFTFGCPLLETVVDNLTIKVVLPEGSKNPSIVVPFAVEQQLETTYSYLDVIGRTTVVIKKKNVVAEHQAPFQVYYDFNPIFMLAEPLMLVYAFFLFFITCIAYLNVDLSIKKS